MKRDANGDMVLENLDTLNQSVKAGYDNLVWDYSIFGRFPGTCQGTGMGRLFSRFGTSGVTIGLTGEAAVNMEEYPATIPFNMCHEVAHLLAIAVEDGSKFCRLPGLRIQRATRCFNTPGI